MYMEAATRLPGEAKEAGLDSRHFYCSRCAQPARLRAALHHNGLFCTYRDSGRRAFPNFGPDGYFSQELTARQWHTPRPEHRHGAY
jgi:hypothetical protein